MEWQGALKNVTLPLRDSQAATVSGGAGASESVDADEFLSSGHTRKNSMVFHTEKSNSDIPIFLQSLSDRGDIRSLSELSSVSLSPVLSMGGIGTGLGYHQHDEAWLAMIRGGKQWFFRAPDNPGNKFYRRVSMEALQDESGVVKCRQRAGEVIYFPEGWWHATYNLPDEVDNLTIAIGGQGSVNGFKGMVHRSDIEALKKSAAGMSKKNLKALAHDAGVAGHVSVLEWLAERGAKLQSIREPCFNGHTGVLEWLLKQRVSVHTKDGNGHSPLEIAARRGHLSILSKLIEHRARVDQQTLEAAALAGHVVVLKLLAKHGANLGMSDSKDMSPIHSAIKGGHAQVVSYMLDEGARHLAAALPECPNLRSLDARNNHMEHEGTVHFAAALPKCLKLEEVLLNTTMVCRSDKDMQLLRQAAAKCPLCTSVKVTGIP